MTSSVMSRAFIYPASSALHRKGRELYGVVPQLRMAPMTKGLAVAVIFVAGWYLCLPEADYFDVPWWAVKHKLAGKLLVHEAVFAVYLLLGGLRAVWRGAIPARYATMSSAWGLIALAVWCGVASLLAPYPFHDVGRSARLVFMAILLLAVSHWAARNPLLVLRAFLLGLTSASLGNLILTFQNPIILAAGALPRLLGQNSPGPPMGIAVCLAAWLILVSRRRSDTVLAMIAAVICGAGAMISYSKTGMLAAAMGLLSIAVVSGRVAPAKRGRVLLVALLLLVFGSANYFRGEAGQRMWTGFSEMIEEKVASAKPGESISVNQRWGYFVGVGEILGRYPLGVGYSGFRDAMMATDVHRAGQAADESVSEADESNPHSLFLYYASAGGFVGGALTVAIFGLMCRALFLGLGLYGTGGTLLAAFGSLAYFVQATSVQYLFNMGVMLIPVAIAAGIYAHITHAWIASPVSTQDRTIAPATQ